MKLLCGMIVCTVRGLSVTFVDSTVVTSSVPTDGPLLLLMLNMMDNLTTSGVVSWGSIDIVHYIVEVRLFHRPHESVSQLQTKLEMWANAQRDGHPAENRWRPLFSQPAGDRKSSTRR